MKIQKIKDGQIINKMTKVLTSEEQVSSYKIFRNVIDNCNENNYFVVVGNNHLSLRGNERLGVNSKEFLLENMLAFITQDEDLFWTIFDYTECFVMDEVNKIGYFLEVSCSNVDGHIVNKIYCKTLLPLYNHSNIYVNKKDGVISYNGNEIIENPSHIKRK